MPRPPGQRGQREWVVDPYAADVRSVNIPVPESTIVALSGLAATRVRCEPRQLAAYLLMRAVVDEIEASWRAEVMARRRG